MQETIGQKKLRQVLMAGASPAILAAHLIVALPSQAADITISSSITTGTVWSATLNPGSNLTVTNTGTINTSNAYGITITGTAGSQLGTLLNNGVITDTAANGRAVFIQAGSVSALVNTGTISATTYALWNAGSLGTMSNSGLIDGRLVNQSTIGAFTNTGTLTYTSFTWDNESQIRTFTNSGLIYGDRAIYSQGTIGTLINTNTGTINGTINAITITGVGGINSISNSGRIFGNILNSGTVTPTISGGTLTTIGTLAGTLGSVGTITSANAGLLFSSGKLYLNDHINVGTNTVTNAGASLTVTSALSITGTLLQSAGTIQIEPNAGRLVVNRPVSLTGGSVVAGLSSISNYLAGDYTIIAGASGSNYTGLTLSTSTLTGASAATSISGNNVITTFNNNYVGGTLATLSNSGTISGSKTATYIAATGSVGTLSNTGTLSGATRGIFMNFSAQVGTITNSGRIVAVAGAGAAGGIANAGTIATIVNTGTIISGASSGIGLNQNVSSIGQITNSGLISAATGAIYNQGTIGTVNNTGQMLGAQGLSINGGTVGLIGNSGTITGSSRGIYLSGILSSVSNSGTLSGPAALHVASGSTLGPITNSGLIAGSIVNLSSSVLTISGGAGATVGTLTGQTVTNKGSIVNTLSNVVFASGNLLLNDNINATGRTVSNIGASLRLNSIINVTGGFNQTSGTLTIDPTQAGLIATGAVSITGGTVVSSFSSTGNYLAGAYTLVGGSSLNLTGATVSINTVTGLYRTTSTVGTGLLLNVNNYYVGGTLTTLNNSATITSASTGVYLATTGQVGTLTNSGTLGGAQFGVNNRGTIGTLSNSGRITNNNFTALWNQGSIGLLTNSGTITNSSWAILNSSTIATLTNSGVISGSGNAIQNNGVINLINNSGTLSGGSNAMAGTFGTIINSGIIRGHINKDGGRVDTIIGGSGGTIGTLIGSNGTTLGTLGVSSNLVFASGDLLLHDNILAKNVAASIVTISNVGANITLSTIVNIDANYTQTGGSLNLGNSGQLVVSRAASITGGTISAGSAGLSSTSSYLYGSAGGTLVSGGAGSNYTGVVLSSSGGGITGLAVSGTTSGTNLVMQVGNYYIGNSQTSVGNTATLTNVLYGVYVASTGTLGTLFNSGTLTSNDTSGAGVSNNSTITTVINSGRITGSGKGFGNQSTILSMLNSIGGTIIGGTAAGLQNDTYFGTLTNAGYISSGSAGFANYGTMGVLSNTGSINGGPQGIYLDGNSTLTSLTNSGTITASQTAVQISGRLSVLTNSGSIGNATNALNVAGTLGTLINQNGGTISGVDAVYISGSIGGFSNSGVISGRINNQSANNLTITGGASGTIGTLTGQSGMGTIINTLSNLFFASGNLLLNDRIIATGRTVTNSGASLTFNSIVSITGNYAQTAGTLDLSASGSGIVVSGGASITGGTIATSLVSTGNYLVGTGGTTLVSAGAASSYTGVSIVANSLTGIGSVSNTVVGNNLLLMLSNHYVGGTLGTLSQTGSLSAATALYIASTGNLGTLVNSGTLSGNINNQSSNNLTIAGGTSGTIGTLTGTTGQGTINNTLSNVVLASGNLLLNDSIVATGRTVSNSGATVTLTSIVNVTGDYGQTGGQLILNSGAKLVVSGAASITGGTVAASLSATGNYAPGLETTLVSTGAASAVSGVVTVTGLSGLITSSTLTGNNLVLTYGSHYVGGTLGSLANTGTVSAATAVYVASTGNLGSLVNTGTLSGNIVNQAARDLTIAGGGAGTVGVLTGGTITSTLGNVVLGPGNLLLNDRVNVASGTLRNNGASLTFNSIVSVTGNYAQSTGTLTVDPGTSGLAVSGGASITGGTIVTGIVATGNYLVGTSTLVSAGAASNYTGVSVTGGSITGLASASTVSGNNLLLNISNDYVGGTLGTLNNTGSVNAATAVYIASTGNLGTLVNSGTLTGNIVNQSTRDLTLAGGTSGTVGTLTGGTITNTLSNVVLAAGNLLLNDRINLGSGTLVNSGASASLISVVNVTGNYGQTSGQLILNSGAKLVVSGAASITGGTVAASLSATGNYAPGLETTLVSAGAASAVSGVVTVTGLSGLITSSTLTGNNLVLTYGNHYVGGTLGSLANSGTVSAATAVYVASTGNLGSLVNTGTLSGNIVNQAARDLTIAGGGAGTVGVLTGGTITSTLGNVVLASGNLLLNDRFNVGSGTLINSGAAVTLQNSLQVSKFSQTDGQLNLNGNSLTVTGAASITAGIVRTNLSSTGNYLIGDSNVLVYGGTGSRYDGVTVAGLTSIPYLSASAGVDSNNLIVSYLNNYIGGYVPTLNNSNSISDATVIYIARTGNLGALNNSGTITGNIINQSDRTLVINGGDGSVTGTFTGGTITSTNANVVLASGKILLTDTVDVGSGTLVNSGATVNLPQAMNLTGNFSQTAGQLVIGNNVFSVSGAANVTGGTIVTSLSATGNYLAGAQNATLIAGGAGSSYEGVNVSASITGLSAKGTVGGNNLLLSFANHYVGGSLSTINNTGSLSAATAVYIAATGNLGALNNSGTINGNITNLSNKALVINGGTGSVTGSLTGGIITSTNANVLLASGDILLGDDVNVGGGTLVNSGAVVRLTGPLSVSGNYAQTSGALTIGGTGGLLVSGAANISGGTVAASLSATGNYLVGGVGSTLVAGGAGSSYVGALVTVNDLKGLKSNSTISGNNLLLSFANNYVGGSLSAIDNNGSLSAATAVYIAATGNLGALNNSGTINGNITNLSSKDLVINGGGDNAGLFTGGVISSANANVVLSSGNILLGDSVNVGSKALVNSGASVTLAGALNVTGNYSQTGGVLSVGSNVLSVSGAANVSGGTILSNLSATGNYLAGSQGTTLIAGGDGSSYVGAKVSAGLTGLAASGTVSGNNLVLAVTNNYVGGNLSAINNSGSLSAATAVYIAATGNLGALNNTGTINGNITNLSNKALVINGASSGTGSFTGGVISSTNANVVLSSGNILLADAVNVGANTLVNGGASVKLAGAVSVTGNYSQANGVLDVGSNILSVSGAAQITGGTIAANLSATGNYLVGSGGTLVAGGAGSSFSGASIVVGGLTGLGASSTVSGNNLLMSYTNNYVGGSLSAIDNSGSLSAATAVYIAATGNLGALNNTGTINGNITNLSNKALVINGANSGTGSFTGGVISSANADVVLSSGNILLGDAVNVGSKALVNSGASVTLAGGLNVTGNYNQGGGVLNLAGNVLSVSGAANVSGGTILSSLSATGNYLAGSQGATLIAGGAGSSYAGANVSAGVIGLAAGGTVSGNNLVLAVTNNYVGGSLSAISNTGSLSAATAVYIAATGNLGALNNTGAINGNITNLSANALVINGGTGSVTGSFTGGTISSTGANVVLSSGNILLADAVNVGANTLVNGGASVKLAGAVSVTGNYSQASGVLDVGSNILSVSGAAKITGGTIAANLSATGNYLVGSGGTLVAGGAGSSFSGASIVVGGLTGLGASSTVSGNNLLMSYTNNYVGGSLSAINNSGSLSAATAVYIAATGNLGALNNTGTINGNITNLSNKALVINGGTGSVTGSFTGGTISSTGANVVLSSGNILLADAVNVGSNALVNSGASVRLTGPLSVTGNYSQTAGLLNVSGNVLSVSGAANVSGGTILSSLSATGNYLAGSQGATLIAGGAGSSYAGANVSVGVTGLVASGATVGNSLLVSFANNYVGGSLSAINNSGSLNVANAVYIAATGNLGALNNTGTINGNITNLSANALVINGGTGSVTGSFTGGTISSTGANVVLSSGNILLADAVNVGANTLVNGGASVKLAGAVAVTGNYSQASGVLDVGSNILSVSGAAKITGGTIAANLSATGNYLVGGGGTLVAGGAGSSFSGASIVVGGLTGLAASSTVSGNNMLMSYTNNYVGGSLSAINNSGSLSAATAVYIAATGNLGALNNTGTINGNITNLSNKALVINGGTGSVTGSFTGGTISSTGANVVLSSGNILLADAVNVGSNALVNSGASVRLTGPLSVTGNYSQTAGRLDVNGNVLSVSGAASITGGTVATSLAATGNYLAGSQRTLVTGGTGSNYTGVAVSNSLTGLIANGATSGTNLVLNFANNYVGGALDNLTNSGSLSAGTALYIAGSGSLGTLSNSGTIAGNITNLSARDLLIAGGSATAPGVLTGLNGSVGRITNRLSDVRFVSGTTQLNSAIDVGTRNVVNAGATLLVNSAISITGSFTQSAGALVFGIGSDNAYGSLQVSGTSALTSGTVTLTPVAGAAFTSGNSYTIVRSGGTITLGNLTFTAGGFNISPSIVSAGGFNDLIVKLQSNFTEVGVDTGGAAIGTGAALDKIAAIATSTSPSAAAVQTQVLTPLSQLSQTEQQTAITQLSPNQLTPQLSVVLPAPASAAVGQHQQVASNALVTGEKGLAAGSSSEKGAIWGELLGNSVRRDTTTSAAGYKGNSGGLLTGVDWFATDNLAVGMAFSWMRSNTDGRGPMSGSSTKINSYQLTSYATWRPEWADSRLAVGGQLGAGYNDFNQKRYVLFLKREARANYGGEQYLGKADIGYDLFRQGDTVVTPKLSLRAVRLVNHAYEETGADVVNLAVMKVRTDAVTQELGVQAKTTFGSFMGPTTIDLDAGWVHDYLKGPIATTGVLAGVTFSSTSERPAADGVIVRLGATVAHSDSVDFRIEYGGELRSKYLSNTVLVRTTFRF